jgi:hypothetical protein
MSLDMRHLLPPEHHEEDTRCTLQPDTHVSGPYTHPTPTTPTFLVMAPGLWACAAMARTDSPTRPRPETEAAANAGRPVRRSTAELCFSGQGTVVGVVESDVRGCTLPQAAVSCLREHAWQRLAHAVPSGTHNAQPRWHGPRISTAGVHRQTAVHCVCQRATVCEALLPWSP